MKTTKSCIVGDFFEKPSREGMKILYREVIIQLTVNGNSFAVDLEIYCTISRQLFSKYWHLVSHLA